MSKITPQTKVTRRRNGSKLQWIIADTNEVIAVLDGLAFCDLDPTFEQALINACKVRKVSLKKDNDVHGKAIYGITLTGLKKILDLL